jgi:hypothetical protein
MFVLNQVSRNRYYEKTTITAFGNCTCYVLF